MAFGKKGVDQIIVPELDIRRMSFWVEGNAPFVSHAWSEKSRKMMEEAQSGKPKQGKKQKEGRIPYEEFVDSIYFSDEDCETHFKGPDGTKYERRGRPGIPARMFKAAAVEAATDVGVFKTAMRSAFFVEGDILPIIGDAPQFRSDPVRLESGVASIAYRAMFPKWSVKLIVKFNAGVISPAHIINLFRTAGFGVGIGEGRAKSKKSCGMGWGSFGIGDEIVLLVAEKPEETEIQEIPEQEQPQQMNGGARKGRSRKQIDNSANELQ